jgi:hypothetical protein
MRRNGRFRTFGAPAFAIAVRVVRHGFGSLSWKERFIYLGLVATLLRRMNSRAHD